MHQKAKQIPLAIIKPNNRCFYVLTFKNMKLQFDAWRVMFICVIFRAKPKWGKQSVCFASQMEKQTVSQLLWTDHEFMPYDEIIRA